MEESLTFAAFTVFPASALVLGTAYSLREIYRLDQNRFYLIVLILGFMLFHQVGEFAYFLQVGEFRDPVIAETPETAANLIAAGSVYHVLSFTRREQKLKTEIEESKTEIETVKDRWELIFGNVNDGILLVNLDDNEIVEANRRANELLRYPQGELEGLSPYDIHPHEPEQFRKLTDVLQPDGGVVSEKLSCRRRDGSKMPAAVSASRTTLADTELLLVTIRDNTEREQYRTQVDLLGRVLRHNLRNDMSVIIGNLGTIKKQVDDTELSDTAEWSIQRCLDLLETSDQTRKLNEVLDTEHRQISAVADLAAATEDVVEEYGSEYPAAQIETDFPECAPVQAGNNVVWAIENIVENAIVHAESEPRVRVTISNETIEQEGQTSTWTTLTVADTGPGIPKHEVAVLADDANRTPIEHGSGLGLWIVKQITQVFDGQLDIARNPNSEFSTEVSLRLQPGVNGCATGTDGE